MMTNLKYKIRSSLLIVYRVLDIFALAFALWTAFKLGTYQGTEYIYKSITNPTIEQTIFFLGLIFSWSLTLSLTWLYRSKRLAGWEDELLDVFKAVLFCTLVLATMVLLAEWTIIPKRFLLIFFVISFSLLFIFRLGKRQLLKELRLNGRNLRSVIIVGYGPRGQKVADLIKEHKTVGYDFLGFVDNIGTENVLGKIDDIREILVKNVVDELIVCLPIKTFYEKMEDIVKAAEEQGVTVRIYSDLFNMKLAKAVSGELGEVPILSLHTGPQSDWQMVVKNMIDFTGALFLIILLSPLMLLIYFAIRVTSEGEAVFQQERIGFNKHPFSMYKFRTMVVNAEELLKKLEAQNEADGPVFKMRDDPRITSIGKFLRKTSLDELPQLFNVLLGDLSLVGPRPLPLRDVKNFNEYWFNRRFSVKPGITCIWQISGRSETSFDKWILQDLAYIDEWSLLLDLKILLKTPSAVMRGSGAM